MRVCSEKRSNSRINVRCASPGPAGRAELVRDYFPVLRLEAFHLDLVRDFRDRCCGFVEPSAASLG